MKGGDIMFIEVTTEAERQGLRAVLQNAVEIGLIHGYWTLVENGKPCTDLTLCNRPDLQAIADALGKGGVS